MSSAIPHRQLGKLFAHYWGELWPASPTYPARLYKPMFDSYDLLTKAQDNMLHRILVPILVVIFVEK